MKTNGYDNRIQDYKNEQQQLDISAEKETSIQARIIATTAIISSEDNGHPINEARKNALINRLNNKRAQLIILQQTLEDTQKEKDELLTLLQKKKHLVP